MSNRYANKFASTEKKSLDTVTEHEIQIVLPSMVEYFAMLDYLSSDKKYRYKKTYLMKENCNKSDKIKLVNRTIYEDKKLNIQYEKRVISITQPFKLLDMTTSARICSEKDTDKLVKLYDRNSFTNLCIRQEFIDNTFKNAAIYLTLYFNVVNKNIIDSTAIDMIKYIKKLIDNRNLQLFLLVSNNKFNTVLEAEFMIDGKKNMQDYLEANFSDLIKPIVSELLYANIASNYCSIINNTKPSLQRQRISNKPVNLSVTDYVREIIPNMSKYYISPKADGEHMYVLVNSANKEFIFFFNEKNFTIYQNGKNINNICAINTFNSFNINLADYRLYEGEMLQNKTLLIYDTKYNIASDVIDNDIKEIRKIYSNIEIKEKYSLNELGGYDMIKNAVYNKYSYPIDGMIFSRNDNGVENPLIYKWKENHTVDFICFADEANKKLLLASLLEKSKITQFSLDECYDYFYKYNNVNINLFDVYLVPFIIPVIKRGMPNTHILNEKYNPALHGRIIECGYDYKEGWKLLRIREDKTAPNYYKTAFLSFMNQMYNLTKEMLVNPSLIQIFFKSEKNKTYEAMRYYNSSVRKLTIVKYIKEKDCILDAGSGRGSTYFEMCRKYPDQITMVEIDGPAIMELFDRIYKFKERDSNSLKTKLKVLNGSFIDADDIELLPNKNTYNVFFCSFAVHFAFIDNYTLDVYTDMIGKNLSKDSTVIFLAIDGRALVKRLNEKNEYIILDNNGGEKYKFVCAKDIDKDRFKGGVGQQLSVTYPFSSDATILNEEYLVDFKELEKKLKNKYGYDVIEETAFDIYSPNAFLKLEKSDKEFVSLHKVFVMQKSSI